MLLRICYQTLNAFFSKSYFRSCRCTKLTH